MNDVIGSILKSVAPTIASALLGPLGGAAVSFLAGKFGTANTQEAVQKSLEGFTAADMVKLKELDLEFQAKMAELGIQINLAQIGVNQAEAQSEHWFIAAWRPAIGWTCGVAFAYTYVLLPFAQFLVFTYGTASTVAQLKGLPTLDVGTMMPVLMGMLGLAAARSYDKTQGTSNGH